MELALGMKVLTQHSRYNYITIQTGGTYHEKVFGSSRFDFYSADRALTKALVDAKKSLTKEAYDELRKNQREWIQTTRDEEAEELIDMNGLSKVRAYTAITQNRADEIQSMTEKANRKVPEPGIVKADKDYVTVIAKGEGANRSEALEASWTEAVRLGVGMIISGKSELNNDELNEYRQQALR